MTFAKRRRNPGPAAGPSVPPGSASNTPLDSIELLAAPGPLLLMLEARAPWEYAAMLAAAPWLNKLPTGDGHPVLVFPGLGASDPTTVPLRNFLRDRGYTPYPWRQGFNFGPTHGVLAACREQLLQLANGARGIYHLSGTVLFGPGKQIHRSHEQIVQKARVSRLRHTQTSSA